MIKDICFTKDWLDGFKKQSRYRHIDPAILEKMIYALHLVEQLKIHGLDFVFKGGTSLTLLFNNFDRFSIDIDIVCRPTRPDEIETILKKVVYSSKFSSFKRDEKRSFKPGVPKAHYTFYFHPATQGKHSGSINLDILFEEFLYPEIIEVPLKTKWIVTEEEIRIKVPTIDAITGDKLTAFAPDTIGIPYFKDGVSFSMEIIKQLFDLGRLFEKINSVETVARSFDVFSRREIAYRKQSQSSLTSELVLENIFNTCAVLTKRGKGTNDEIFKFNELRKGIKSFGSGFLITGNFRLEDAISTAGRVAYLSAKLMTKDFMPIDYYSGQSIKDMEILNPEWNFLNKLKKLPDKSAFYYWYKALEILNLL